MIYGQKIWTKSKSEQNQLTMTEYSYYLCMAATAIDAALPIDHYHPATDPA